MRVWHDSPVSLAICGASLYCHANVAQLWSSLNKTRGVAFLWRYSVCLSCTEGHQAVTDPGPTQSRSPNQLLPKHGEHCWGLACNLEAYAFMDFNEISSGCEPDLRPGPDMTKH